MPGENERRSGAPADGNTEQRRDVAKIVDVAETGEDDIERWAVVPLRQERHTSECGLLGFRESRGGVDDHVADPLTGAPCVWQVVGVPVLVSKPFAAARLSRKCLRRRLVSAQCRGPDLLRDEDGVREERQDLSAEREFGGDRTRTFNSSWQRP